MFISENQVKLMAKALDITSNVLHDVPHTIVGVDVTHNVCEYVVNWFEGNDDIRGLKQAKVNAANGSFIRLDEYHSTMGTLSNYMEGE